MPPWTIRGHARLDDVIKFREVPAMNVTEEEKKVLFSVLEYLNDLRSSGRYEQEALEVPILLSLNLQLLFQVWGGLFGYTGKHDA